MIKYKFFILKNNKKEIIEDTIYPSIYMPFNEFYEKIKFLKSLQKYFSGKELQQYKYFLTQIIKQWNTQKWRTLYNYLTIVRENIDNKIENTLEDCLNEYKNFYTA